MERSAAKRSAFGSLAEYWDRRKALVESDEASWSRLHGPDGPTTRALAAATQVLLQVRKHAAAEEAYASELLCLSVAMTTSPAEADAEAGDEAPLERGRGGRAGAALLEAAAKASSDRALASASAARERALRLSQAAGQLEATSAAVRQEAAETARTLKGQRTALAKHHAVAAAAFDELHRAYQKHEQLASSGQGLASRAASAPSTPTGRGRGGGGTDLWLLAHTLLRAVASHGSEYSALTGPMAAQRDGLRLAAERVWSTASSALAAEARLDPEPPGSPSSPSVAAAAAAANASDAHASGLAQPSLPNNPFTLKGGVVTRRVGGVLRDSWEREWAVLTTDRALHLFALSAETREAPAGAALLPAKPLMTIDCSTGAGARAWTPDAPDGGDTETESTVWMTPSSKLVLSSPVASGLWARLGPAVLGGGSEKGSVELDFGTPSAAAEWLEVLSTTPL